MIDMPVEFCRCEKHKGYKGVNPPKAPCLWCWEFYGRKHPDEPVTLGTLFKILDLVDAEVHAATTGVEEGVLDTLERLIASRNDRD